MVVHFDPQAAASLDEEYVRGLDGRVVGVEVCRALDVGELGFGVAICLVVDAGRIERLVVVVGRGDGQAALAQPGNERGAGLVARPLAAVIVRRTFNPTDCTPSCPARRTERS